MTSENNEQAIEVTRIREYCDAANTLLNGYNKNIRIIFAITGLQTNDEAALEIQGDILKLDNGQTLNNAMNRYFAENNTTAGIIGILTKEQKKLLGLAKKQEFSCLANLNIQPDDELLLIKTAIYGFIWQTIDFIKHIEDKKTDFYTKQDNIFIPKLNDVQTSQRNMLGDAFGATLLEEDEIKNAILQIAEMRTEKSFHDLKNYDARLFPFPAILEATELTYNDIVSSPQKNKNTFQMALDIVDEVCLSIDENTVEQWQNFIEPAREMAWSDVPVQQILGAAIYTSDNVYNRSLAQMMSETLKIAAAPIIDFSGYNAFADPESQKRAHKMACLEAFEYAHLKSLVEQRAATFIDFAEQNCLLLLQSKPSGWCTPALVAVAQELNRNKEADKELLFEIFSNEINAVNWSHIRKINKNLIDRRLNNKINDFDIIIDMLRQEDETRNAALTIKTLKNLVAIKKAANPMQPFNWEDVAE